jgi:hypothetical protein
MAIAKWMKLGAAAALSVSMLGACGGDGDGDDDNIEVDDPATGEDDSGEKGPMGEDNTDEQMENQDDEKKDD